MKCKSIVSLLLALTVSSVGVVGMAAEVNTTTTYNTVSDKIEVNTAVSGAEDGSEVTYIVRSSGEVVYIDQDTAEDGNVNFIYKIDKTKLAKDYSTSVKFGSSASDESFIGENVDTLGIVELQQPESTENYTIVYNGGAQAWGPGEKVTAVIDAKEGYEVTAIYIDGVRQDVVGNTVEITYGQTVTADVQKVVVESGVNYIALGLETESEENKVLKSRIVILKPYGNVDKIGVVYDGNFYASAVNEMSAVKIIFPADVTEDECQLVGAYKSDGTDEVKLGTEALDSEK